MKSYSDIVKNLQSPIRENSYIREKYVRGEIFNIGESVELKDGTIAEIIARGPNYITVVQEGKSSKKWLNEVKESDVDTSKRNQIYKEDFIIKGYRTKNFTRELSEQFSQLCKETKDLYAVYNCVVSLDNLLGEININEDFTKIKTNYDRAVKYTTKFNIVVEQINDIGDKLLEYALSENVKFSCSDKMKVAEIIAITVGNNNHTEDPIQYVNESANTVKGSKYDIDGWKILGSLFNKATEAGIDWNKDIFNRHTQRYMGLR